MVSTAGSQIWSCGQLEIALSQGNSQCKFCALAGLCGWNPGKQRILIRGKVKERVRMGSRGPKSEGLENYHKDLALTE